MKIYIATIVGENEKNGFGDCGYKIKYDSGRTAIVPKKTLQEFVKSGDYYITNAKDYPEIYKYQK